MDRIIIAKKRMGSFFGKEKPFPFEWICDAESALQETTGAILQINDPDYKSRIGEAVVAKGVGGTTIAGLAGLVGAFGTASTGTAIASLSGAAATTAKLYWIGSLVGGGAVAGGGMLVGFAALAGWGGIKLWKGSAKTVASLEENEGRVLLALNPVLSAIQNLKDEKRSLSSDELIALDNWCPVFLQSLNEYRNDKAYKKLAIKHKFRLWRATRGLNKFHRRLQQWTK
jgi:hypothetical protein